MSPPQTMLTLPLDGGREATMVTAWGEGLASCDEKSADWDEGPLVALGEAGLDTVFVSPLCIGIADAAATAAPAAAIAITISQAVLALIPLRRLLPPRRFMPLRRFMSTPARADCGSPF